MAFPQRLDDKADRKLSQWVRSSLLTLLTGRRKESESGFPGRPLPVKGIKPVKAKNKREGAQGGKTFQKIIFCPEEKYFKKKIDVKIK